MRGRWPGRGAGGVREVLKRYSDMNDYQLSGGMCLEPGAQEVRDALRQARQDWDGHVSPAGKVLGEGGKCRKVQCSRTPHAGRQYRPTGAGGVERSREGRVCRQEAVSEGSRVQAWAPQENENHWLLGGRGSETLQNFPESQNGGN